MADLIENTDILVYKYNGSSNTAGELQCVIFYDKMLNGGLFAGGVAVSGPTTDSSKTIEFLQFSNETCSDIYAQLISPTNAYTLVDNSNYIWICGGGQSTSYIYNTIQRINKSSLTTDASFITTLDEANYLLSSKSNTLYGYFFGGSTSWGATNTNKIQRLTFSTEINADTTANLINSIQGSSTIIDWPTYNYVWICGGDTTWGGVGGQVNVIQKYDLTDYTVTAVDKMDLNNTTAHHCGCENETYGYIMGGWENTGSNVLYNTIEKITFASDTGTATDIADLLTTNYGLAATMNSSHTDCYIAGGILTDGGDPSNMIQKYVLSTDTVNTIYRTNLQQGRGVFEGATI